MFRKQLIQFRPFIALISVVVFWLLAPVFIKSLLKTTFYEFQAPVSVTASYIRELQDFWAGRLQSKDEIYEAGKDLARLNSVYELKVVENQSLAEEVARLEELLQLPSRPGYRYEIARVVERDFNSWWRQLIIRKGSIHNVRPGAPVVFTGGVVGRVQEVRKYTSVVNLISNIDIRLAVVLEGDNRVISYTGTQSSAFGKPRGIAEYVPTDIKVVDPNNLPRLLTSGLGGVFPPGLPVGYIKNLRQGAGGMFLDGDVELDSRLTHLNEVAVLIPILDSQP